MEQFHDGQLVWLRSRVHGTYLHADDDGEGVSLRRRRTSLNAAWVVHIYPGDDGPCLLLHNAAYGRYLAATTTPAPLGHRGFRAVQRNYDQSEVEASQDIMWQAVGAGSGNDIMLRNVSGCGRYLRANGRYLIWNNGVSVDEFDRVSTMRHWIVEPIPARLGMPALPGPARTVMLRRAAAPWQLIRFLQGIHRGGLVRFPFHREVRVPSDSEEQAGQPRRSHRRPLWPHHVRPSGLLREADPTRRRPAPRPLLQYHRPPMSCNTWMSTQSRERLERESRQFASSEASPPRT
ncbi:unnamed protein product [Alopecurus aequalis]